MMSKFTFTRLQKSSIALLFLLVTNHFYAQTPRVVGYVPDYRLDAVNQIDFTKVTHINYSFGNPDGTGNLVVTNIARLKQAALAMNPNVKILLSIGGGAVNVGNWNAVLASSSSRAAFITQLVNYTTTNAIAGIDVDLEWDFAGNNNYSPFVLELSTALKAQNKLMTAALPPSQFSVITQAALDAFDFINIMAYDYTGPWQPGSPGQHSSLANAQSATTFWKSKVASSKLNLGVPFYSYSFTYSNTDPIGPKAVTSRTFGEIVAANPANADVDQIGNNPNNYNEYYNGRPTIEAKVALSKSEALGGIMIWELGQDSFGQYSLLTTIANKYATLGTSSFEATAFSTYPNPTNDVVTISMNDLKNIETIQINDFLGKTVQSLTNINNSTTTVNMTNFSSGVYFAKITSEGKQGILKLVKR